MDSHKWKSKQSDVPCTGPDCPICKMFKDLMSERHEHRLWTTDGKTRIDVTCQGGDCPFCAIGLEPGAVLFVRGCEHPGCDARATHKSKAFLCLCDEHYQEGD